MAATAHRPSHVRCLRHDNCWHKLCRCGAVSIPAGKRGWRLVGGELRLSVKCRKIVHRITVRPRPPSETGIGVGERLLVWRGDTVACI